MYILYRVIDVRSGYCEAYAIVPTIKDARRYSKTEPIIIRRQVYGKLRVSLWL